MIRIHYHDKDESPRLDFTTHAATRNVPCLVHDDLTRSISICVYKLVADMPFVEKRKTWLHVWSIEVCICMGCVFGGVE
jgi:hypothetical protein